MMRGEPCPPASKSTAWIASSALVLYCLKISFYLSSNTILPIPGRHRSVALTVTMAGREFACAVLLLCLASFLQRSEGFIVLPRSAPAIGATKSRKKVVSSMPISTMDRSTQLWKTQSDLDELQGTNIGKVILFFVMLFVIWGFTIPVEIRRSSICTDDRCLSDRSKCYNCKTLGELSQEVKEYYANGGGIKFDFSVDPNNPFLIK